MKHFLIAVSMVAAGATMVFDTAEAARVGGGRSVGTQRAAPMQRQAQPAAPAQSANAANPATPASAPAPVPQGNRWLGPIAGLAAGLGLGWLLGHGGLGGMMGGLLMALLAAGVIFMLIRVFARPRTPQPAAAMQYSGLGNETVAAPPPSQMPYAAASSAAGAQPDYGNPSQPQIPAGFDVEGFLKQAKLNFVRLQEANDRGDLDMLREVATDEMFSALKDDLAGRVGAGAGHTEVLSLNASLLEVVTEGSHHWASIRFSGSLREGPGAAPSTFEEVWNLQKATSGKTGWLLAGIQQVS